jgi:hypothetical protein
MWVVPLAADSAQMYHNHGVTWLRALGRVLFALGYTVVVFQWSGNGRSLPHLICDVPLFFEIAWTYRLSAAFFKNSLGH